MCRFKTHRRAWHLWDQASVPGGTRWPRRRAFSAVGPASSAERWLARIGRGGRPVRRVNQKSREADTVMGRGVDREQPLRPRQPGQRDLALARTDAIPATGPWRCQGIRKGAPPAAPRFCPLTCSGQGAFSVSPNEPAERPSGAKTSNSRRGQRGRDQRGHSQVAHSLPLR